MSRFPTHSRNRGLLPLPPPATLRRSFRRVPPRGCPQVDCTGADPRLEHYPGDPDGFCRGFGCGPCQDGRCSVPLRHYTDVIDRNLSKYARGRRHQN